MFKFTAGKVRYLVPAILIMLILGAVLIAVVGMNPGPPRDPVSIALFGRWVGPKGNSITFYEDGTTLGREYDDIDGANFLWWVDEGILTFRRIRNEQVYRSLVRSLFDRLPGAKRDDYKIIKLTDDTLLLLDLDKNTAISFERCDVSE